nr:uncharacterized protein LOC111518049 [Leptinotarsa decemlineata]XP_023030143.1 uncharacterized protein LOC111518049 [Leptinotarsa decemlineata]
MAHCSYKWVFTVFVFFDVVKNGYSTIDTGRDVSNYVIEYIRSPNSQNRSTANVEVENNLYPIVDSSNLLNGDGREGVSNGVMRSEEPNISFIRKIIFSALNSSKEKEIEKANGFHETSRNTVHEGVGNLYDNNLATRDGSEIKTIQGNEGEDLASSGPASKDIKRKIIGNELNIQVQVKFEYDTNIIPSDIQNYASPGNPVNKKMLVNEKSKDYRKKGEASNLQKKNLDTNLEIVIGDLDRQLSQKKKPFHDFLLSTKFGDLHPEMDTETNINAVPENNYNTFARNKRTEEISQSKTSNDIRSKSVGSNGKNNTPKITLKSSFPDSYPAESAVPGEKNSPPKISLRSSFLDSYPSESKERETNAILDEAHTYKDSTTVMSVDLNIAEAQVVKKEIEDVVREMEKRLEKFMYVQIALALVMFISSIITLVYVLISTKKRRRKSGRNESSDIP